MLGKTKEDVWPIDPHTVAKHEILCRYLDQWLPILGRYWSRLTYVDGFAGPGTYSGGEDGSPVIAIERMRGHKYRPKAGVNFVFIEKEAARAEHLQKILHERFSDLPEGWGYSVHVGNFSTVINDALEKLEKEEKRPAPTFFLVDPFGYSEISMDTMSRILAHPRCEVLITLMVHFAARFLGQTDTESALTNLYGSELWRQAEDIPGLEERSQALLGIYEQSLQEEGGANFVRSYEMCNDRNQILYYLVFATGHIKGLQAMKEAMWNVGHRGQYRFLDRTAGGQMTLLDVETEDVWLENAAHFVSGEFGGKRVRVDDLEEFVWTETPFRFRKGILKKAEDLGLITEVEGRKRRGTFPAGASIKFS